MTAHQFIEQLYARPAYKLPSNMRSLTGPQLELLRDLIGQDEEGGALRSNGPAELVWMPSGRWKYILREDPLGRRHTLERLGNLMPSGIGKLF